MARYYREADGMEPRLTFRLSNSWEFTILLPVGQEWEDRIIEAMQTNPAVVIADITNWRGERLVNLQNRPNPAPYVKPPKDGDCHQPLKELESGE